jgi:RNA polymerase sigma-70 factor (ECF subfamily)
VTLQPAPQGRQEPAGFEELAMPLLSSLFNFAQWLTRNRDDAEDLVQETFTKALRGYGSYQPGTNFRSWIFRILKNTFLTSRAGLKAHPLVPLADGDGAEGLGASPETPETILIASADRELVRAAIESLPEVFQEAVVLRDVEGLSYQEIADALSVPVGTVMSRLARGRLEIRRHVARRLGRKEPS